MFAAISAQVTTGALRCGMVSRIGIKRGPPGDRSPVLPRDADVKALAYSARSTAFKFVGDRAKATYRIVVAGPREPMAGPLQPAERGSDDRIGRGLHQRTRQRRRGGGSLPEGRSGASRLASRCPGSLRLAALRAPGRAA